MTIILFRKYFSRLQKPNICHPINSQKVRLDSVDVKITLQAKTALIFIDG